MREGVMYADVQGVITAKDGQGMARSISSQEYQVFFK
jgi:hypothetical protein